MNQTNDFGQPLALALATAWHRIERQLDGPLGAITGISLAEYRLLRSLADSPHARASRVDLARAVGLTPSGVTRALRPLEKRGVVSSQRSERDARMALASLTESGRELLANASKVVDDAMNTVLHRAPKVREQHKLLMALLDTLSHS